MNFFKIIEQLAEVDADALGRFDSRRAVFQSLGTLAKRTALATTPVLLGSVFQKAYAGTNADSPIDILNYALTLELLEADFYKKFVEAGKIPMGAPAAAIAQIRKHEDSHVALLTNVIKALNGNAVTGVKFKKSVFDSLDTYEKQLQVAQVLEDVGVRAYKGRAAELTGTPDSNIPGIGNVNLLTAALQIHSVEARHAAHIRYMRGQSPWVSNDDDVRANAAYTGATPESNLMQAGYDLTKDLGTPYSAADVAAAFDEPLTPAEVLDMSRAGGLVD
ncbi:MAG TPA: ferritin-like domain-containing protein [Hymenobacter sp.]|jgi:rubrerythrin